MTIRLKMGFHLEGPMDDISVHDASSDHPGPMDDVVIFNFNARSHGIGIWLSNEFDFGYLPKPNYPGIDNKVRQG